MPRSKKDVPRKRKPSVPKKTKSTKALKPRTSKPIAKAAGKSRAEGIRLFKLAGRPTKEQFIVVYGERGPKMTWEQRAKAGVPAGKFQAALVARQSGRKDVKPSIPAPAWKE